MIAPSTERRFTRDLMFDAVPNSSASILLTREIWSLGGMMREIILVPFLKIIANKIRKITSINKKSGTIQKREVTENESEESWLITPSG